MIAVAGAALLLLARSVRHRARTVLARLRLGLAILDQPRDYLCGVVRWQALGRLIRLGSLACFLAAFALPVTLATVVLVMGAQSGTRIIPVAPASAGLRIAMLGYGFASITGDVSLRRFEMTEARGTPVEEMERPFLRSPRAEDSAGPSQLVGVGIRRPDDVEPTARTHHLVEQVERDSRREPSRVHRNDALYHEFQRVGRGAPRRFQAIEHAIPRLCPRAAARSRQHVLRTSAPPPRDRPPLVNDGARASFAVGRRTCLRGLRGVPAGRGSSTAEDVEV